MNLAMNRKHALLLVVIVAILGGGVSAFLLRAHKSKPLPDYKTVANINDLKYPAEAWSPMLLAKIDRGPALLSRDENIRIPPPPANDSPQTKAELDLLRKYAHENRTPEEVALIVSENEDNLEFMGRRLHSEKIDKATLMALRELDYFLMKAKRDFARPRPTQMAPDLTTLIPVPPHAAYPSGHASQTWIMALVQDYIDPENRAFYQKYAMDVARRREIAGVHYPSDGEAGRAMSDQIFAKLMTKPEFKKAIDEAKEEFATQTTN